MVTFHIIKLEKKHNPGFVDVIYLQTSACKKHIIHIYLCIYWNLLMLFFYGRREKKMATSPVMFFLTLNRTFVDDPCRAQRYDVCRPQRDRRFDLMPQEDLDINRPFQTKREYLASW